MQMIADGDSSVYATIIKNIPIWGPHVQKIECANHATKCLRSNLEKLVSEKTHYKGKGRLTKNNIRRITAGVRCAIIMRSKEENKNEAIKKLRQDIRNAGRHVLGHHDMCSTDFCKHKKDDLPPVLQNDDFEELQNDSGDVIICQSDYWRDSMQNLTKEETESLRKGGCFPTKIDSITHSLLKDVYIFLNRLAEKSNRLICNFISNLAEAWMNVRCKFDGGKMYNKCFKGSFYARCYGAALRSILGPAWSPIAFQQIFKKRPDKIFINTYKYRVNKRLNANKSSKKKENILRRKRKREESSILRKKGKADYGEEVLIDTDDISKENLELECENYFKTEIMNVKIDEIEKKTRGQSSNDLWHDERKKRLTSSIFGDVMSRSLNNNSSNIIKRLLYSKFKGNIYTIRGQNEEENARIEYKNIKNKSVNTVKTIQIPGLVVDKERPYLASSSDGIVISEEGPNGLIEIKTLLNNSKKLIHEAAESDKNFCLKMENGKICLKRNHKYFY
jgi:hypothetical protein